ncbi:hypothetical protein AOT14_33970 [Stenotrophomonas acidaminiphila]|uniref:Uncharacterized protein n=1 Tax=Stenotrophomonas acidaminiphila TaxID=128780 RepID=A0A0S1B3V8_9GAMM|nr:hypothetical protein [Stenotrophomonas acidaminiphila]ALJ29737.1 hypothetical protein AOT14_33970 [Stenotrophomonas acidaminiphila]
MGCYISVAPRVRKQQVFKISGTFTPSPGLIAAGGVVEVELGAGGGGASGPYYGGSSSARSFGSGGGEGERVKRILTGVVSPQAVVIGAGGDGGGTSAPASGNYNGLAGQKGGDSSFGVLLTVRGGLGGEMNMGVAQGGAAGGEGASPGVTNVFGSAFGSSNPIAGGTGGGAGGGAGRVDALPNSCGGGAGGGTAGKGGSGYCIVTWEE